jgi:hypothetical protein
MPLGTATTVPVQIAPAFNANRFDASSYTVVNPLAPEEIFVQVSPRAWRARSDGSAEALQHLPTVDFTGSRRDALMADAGRRMILSAIGLLGLADTATIADLKAVIASRPTDCGRAYHVGTRDALYAALTTLGIFPDAPLVP